MRGRTGIFCRRGLMCYHGVLILAFIFTFICVLTQAPLSWADPSPSPSPNANSGDDPNAPRIVPNSGGTFTFSGYCSQNQQQGAQYLRRLACDGTEQAPGLKQVLTRMLRSDVGTIIGQYYFGYEYSSAEQKPNPTRVPVCNLASGEGDLLATSATNRRSNAPRVDEVQACFERNRTVEAVPENGVDSSEEDRTTINARNCVGPNGLREQLHVQQRNANLQWQDAPGGAAYSGLENYWSCGQPCQFYRVTSTRRNSSGGEEDVTEIIPRRNTCQLEFAWIRGMWPQMLWYATTASSANLSASHEQDFESSVLSEIQQGTIKITKMQQGTEAARAPCEGLKRIVEDLSRRVDQVDSQLKSRLMPQAGGRGFEGATPHCRIGHLYNQSLSEMGSIGSEEAVRRFREQAQIRSGRPTIVEGLSQEVCMLEAARLEQYAALGKLAVCEAVVRGQFKYVKTLGSGYSNIIRRAQTEIESNCHDCSDGSVVRRNAAYAVFMRGFVLDNFYSKFRTDDRPSTGPSLSAFQRIRQQFDR